MQNLADSQPVANRILDQFTAANLPALLILHGPSGTNKIEVAEKFIQKQLCEVHSGCGQCVQCRLFQKDEHPDYIRFGEEKVLIGDSKNPEPFTVRWLLQARLHYSPFKSERRFILFPRADLIQHEAETALLKTLEEPPDHTRFLFIVENLDQLKETIISRGQSIPFFRLSHTRLEFLTGINDPEALDILGGSTELLPVIASDFYEELVKQVSDGLSHPLALLELESFLLSRQGSFTKEFEMSFDRLLEITAMLIISRTTRHPESASIHNSVLQFSADLSREAAGLTPFLISRLFHKLQHFLF